MAAVDEIAVKLGLRTGEFKAALREAGAEVKTFAEGGKQHVGAFTESVHETTKAMRLFHHAIMLGGIYEAVKGFYEMAIGYAEKHTEDTDHQTEAVRRFGEAMKDSGGVISKVSVQALGYVNSLGEALGELTAGLMYGFDQAAKARDITEEAQRNIIELRKVRIETEKEIGKLEAQNAATEAKRAMDEFDALDSQTKQAALVKAIGEGLTLCATLDEHSLKFQETKRDVLLYQGQLLKVNAEIEKEANAELEDWWKDFVGFMQQANVTDAEAAEKKKAALADLITKTQAETQASIEVAQAWDDGTKSVYEMIDGVTKLKDETESYIAEWEGFQGTITQKGDVRNLSGVQLGALIDHLQKQIGDTSLQYQSHPGDAQYDFVLNQFKQTMAQALAEQSLRSDFTKEVGRFGLTSAERDFAPGDFSRLQQFLPNPDQAKQNTNNLQAIATGLANKFPGAFAGFRG